MTRRTVVALGDTDTRDRSRPARICNNCWWRRAAPGFATCPPCFYHPHRNRANAHWADLIAQVDADTATDRKAA